MSFAASRLYFVMPFTVDYTESQAIYKKTYKLLKK